MSIHVVHTSVHVYVCILAHIHYYYAYSSWNRLLYPFTRGNKADINFISDNCSLLVAFHSVDYHNMKVLDPAYKPSPLDAV